MVPLVVPPKVVPPAATGGAPLVPQETTFKAEWHRLVWPPHARPLSAAGAWAEAGGAVEFGPGEF